ncbi:MAG: hypothetical protein IT479_13265 [Xanthomonadales bacterium]|nr:hypothetical protein [Xanthomonadales bacterium]MCC6594226.1 hypothetical protein [Xanthomonadales bacterium]MCE7930829.1 hypothetical protein [Xanthomonadales bacterium PRO6]
MAVSNVVRMLNTLLAAVAALLAATALGALWSLFGLAAGSRAAWMAPITSLLLALLLRYNQHPPGPGRACASLSLALLCSMHASYLIAAGFVAASMGLNLFDTLRAIGPDMAWSITRAHLTGFDLLCLTLALLVAVGLGWRQPGESAVRSGKGSNARRCRPPR